MEGSGYPPLIIGLENIGTWAKPMRLLEPIKNPRNSNLKTVFILKY